MPPQPSERAQQLAQALIQARQQARACPPDARWADLSTEEAYAVQALVGHGMGWFQQGVPAWKAGGAPVVSAAPLPEVCSSPAMWRPTAWTGDDAAPSDTEGWIIEAEVAFRLARAPQGPNLAADVVQALGTVAVAIEAIDTRWAAGLAASPPNWKLADQGVHGTLVIGPEQPAQPWLTRTPQAWAGLGWQFRVNGTLLKEGSGGLPAIEPLGAVRWLATHAAQHTGGLRAGDVVTTGAWAVVRARRGDVVEVSFEGLGAAQLTLT
ncbi:MAG: hypothetical protein RLZZ182_2413 [Pseudomonadota bacterium]